MNHMLCVLLHRALSSLLACCLVLMPLAPGARAAVHTVNINGDHTGNAYGNSDDGVPPLNLVTRDNTLNINSGGVVTGSAYGARSFDDVGTIVEGNTVNISGGRVDKDVYGARDVGSLVAGAYAEANENSVNVKGGTVGGSIYGGGAEVRVYTAGDISAKGGPGQLQHLRGLCS